MSSLPTNKKWRHFDGLIKKDFNWHDFGTHIKKLKKTKVIRGDDIIRETLLALVLYPRIYSLYIVKKDIIKS